MRKENNVIQEMIKMVLSSFLIFSCFSPIYILDRTPNPFVLMMMIMMISNGNDVIWQRIYNS